MHEEIFFQDPDLPFAEARYSKNSKRDFKPHIHTTLSIGVIDRGSVQYGIGQESGSLCPGSLLLVNPETQHFCNTIDKEERSFYMLYLDSEWCFRVQQTLWEVSAFTPVEIMQLDDEPLWRQYCVVIKQLMDSSVTRLEKEQILIELVSEIFLKSCRLLVRKDMSSEAIDQLKMYLAEDLERDLTMESLSEKLGLNPYTLLRRFKALTGVTPHVYRMNCRVEKARRYLRQGMSIVDTALASGFYDQSHFHHHFKAITSVTPREYRVNFIKSTCATKAVSLRGD
jgi:AraC-like DNA-binding protein